MSRRKPVRYTTSTQLARQRLTGRKGIAYVAAASTTPRRG